MSVRKSREIGAGEERRIGRKLTVRDITLIGMMVAILEVCKISLSFLPNIELVSFWIILFTLSFRWRTLPAIVIFNLAEFVLYGAGIWWISYLYAWPLLALLTFLFRKQESVWFWSILSSAFGLLFGLLFAIPYVIVGAASGGLRGGLYAGFTWWVAGIPYDITHAVGNFVLMAALYTPVRKVMRQVVRSPEAILPPHPPSETGRR